VSSPVGGSCDTEVDRGLVLRRLLVPVDGSEYSRHAAEHAIRIAQAYGAELLLLHVIDDQVLDQVAQRGEDRQRVCERLHDAGRGYLHDLGRHAASAGVAHREQIEIGDPAALICEVAARAQSDLVVIGKIGRRGARRIVMGSIARRVIEAAEIPVLVVSRPPAAVVSGHDGAAAQPRGQGEPGGR